MSYQLNNFYFRPVIPGPAEPAPGTQEHGISRRVEAVEFGVSGFRVRPGGPPRNDGEEERKLSCYVYLLASRKYGTLYLGITNDLVRRVYEHKTKAVPGFASKYGVDRLVWFEVYEDPTAAISREKELKKWRRDWKISLIERDNPDWRDLYDAIVR